ncbi:ribonuclease H-like domain-containing protein [Penicillium angulare]|uniref:ribonuclease H-like domain-containing protein n=1 Tax=Penicillium angulare TaxID=116970 RepID=UPI0025410064|nr:ribonuclease H-like domain-containing protein [Penicillium angulare]KAJ5288064.1 ribonuclease H-like domain-containing protein [Penicillium angulare]
MTLNSSVPALESLLSSISSSNTLYLDLEGYNLSRNGTISFIALLVHPQEVIRTIDVLAPGALSFTTASHNGKTLKSILEDPNTPKCLWDVRKDADALVGSLSCWSRWGD